MIDILEKDMYSKWSISYSFKKNWCFQTIISGIWHVNVLLNWVNSRNFGGWVIVSGVAGNFLYGWFSHSYLEDHPTPN